jgi:ribosomal protein S6E (S10)
MEYTTTADVGGVNFKPLDHQGATGLLDFKEGTWRIRITWPETVDYRAASATVEVTVTDSRIASAVVLREGASFTYNMDYAVMERAIFENAIDWENSTLPEGADLSDFDIKYKAQLDVLDDSVDAGKLGSLIGKIPGLENIGGGIGDIAGSLGESTKTWMPISGGKNAVGVPYAPMGAGEHKVQITFKGSAEYKPSEAAEGSVTVKKANVKVKVNSTNIRAGQPLPANFITTDPDGKFEFYTIYAGATSNVNLGLYLDLPAKYTGSKLLKILDPVVERIAGKSFTAMLNEGVTLGALRKLVTNTELIDLLEKVGVDTGAFGQIIKVVNALPSITDGVRVGFGVPKNQAGLYTVTVITDNRNYNTGVGVGALLVRMNLKGVKLTWNQDLGKQISAADAKEFDFGATLSFDGDVTISQSSVHYLYSGFTSKWKPYSSTTKAPTEPGRYTMTVVTLGGSYQAAPITRSFQITK